MSTKEFNYHINYNHILSPIRYGTTSLFQLGRLHCTPTTTINTHAHLNWFELTAVTDGCGQITTNGVTSEVQEGDIYLSFPGDFHKITSCSPPMKYNFFSFNSDNEKIKNSLKEISKTSGYENRIFRDVHVSECIKTAISECIEKRAFKDEILSALFEQILYCVIRHFDGEENISENTYNTNSLDELCYKIMRYVDTHLFTIDKLSTISDKFSYNYSYLSSVFKRTTGNSISDYYQKRRLDAAELLLREKKLKIGTISDMLKYSSLYAFSKAFKNRFGTSPKNYLKSK